MVFCYRAKTYEGLFLPKAVHAGNWEINGCPVNGPSIAADGRRVVVAWFTGANSSGFPRMARLGDEVYFAWTEFGKPSHVRVATANVSAYK